MYIVLYIETETSIADTSINYFWGISDVPFFGPIITMDALKKTWKQTITKAQIHDVLSYRNMNADSAKGPDII